MSNTTVKIELPDSIAVTRIDKSKALHNSATQNAIKVTEKIIDTMLPKSSKEKPFVKFSMDSRGNSKVDISKCSPEVKKQLERKLKMKK